MNKKILIPLGILLAGGAAVYALTRKKKGEAVEIDDTKVFGKETQGTSPAFPVASSNFPLTYGSRNSSVKTLQQALRVTADGIFGTITLEALKKATGKTSVKNQAELTTIVNAMAGILQQGEVNSTRLALANALVAQKNSYPNGKLYFTADQKCSVFKADVSGKLFSAGTTVTFKNGEKYSDFKFLYVSNEGFVFTRIKEIGDKIVSVSPYSVKLL